MRALTLLSARRFICVSAWVTVFEQESLAHARNPLKVMQQSLNTNPISVTAGREATTSVMWSPEDGNNESTVNKLIVTARGFHMSSVWKPQPQSYSCFLRASYNRGIAENEENCYFKDCKVSANTACDDIKGYTDCQAFQIIHKPAQALTDTHHTNTHAEKMIADPTYQEGGKALIECHGSLHWSACVLEIELVWYTDTEQA